MTENCNNDTVPIKALRLESRNLISSLLNPPKVIPTENGIPRDWRGLAHLVGLKAEKIPVVACDTDPAARVLNLWARESSVPCTILQLRAFLGELDRYDIIDDARELIAKDIEAYLSEPELISNNVAVIDDMDSKILTVDDVSGLSQGLGTQRYDAFVVFADEDIDFATELIENMEKQYGLKLCVKERDLVAGLPFEHKAIIQLISERCNRLIVIVSPAYLKSSANSFVVNYAQALGIEQGKRKIIPCLYEPCDLPLELKHIFFLRYQRSTRLYNFWERLKNSIQAPTEVTYTARPLSEEIQSNYSEKLPDLKSPNQLKPKKVAVKFGSESNLTIADTSEAKRSASENVLNIESSSSQNHHSAHDKKNKTKFNFIKKFISHKNKDKKTIETAGKENKKKFFSLKPKIKVPVMS